MDDKGEITKILGYFFDALDNCRGESLKKAFAEKATIHAYDEDEGSIVSDFIHGWADDIDKNKSNPDYFFNKEKSEKRIAYIDITGTAASAKVEWRFPSLVFTDYYNLVKGPEGWRLVDKVWNTESKRN